MSMDMTEVVNLWGEKGRGKSNDLYPPWYFTSAMDMLEAEIEGAERRIRTSHLTDEQRSKLQREIGKKKERLVENKMTVASL